MKKFLINYENINQIDKYFNIKQTNIFEKEIKNIVDCFWKNTGRFENNYKPFLISHLHTSWLTRFYIYYFSFKNLSLKYNQIILKDTNSIFNLFKDEFSLKYHKNLKNHDSRFYLNSNQVFQKNILKNIIFFFKFKFQNIFKKEIIFLNAGKLDNDLKEIKNSINAKIIPKKKFHKNKYLSNKLKTQIKKNINNLRLSVPNSLLIKFIEYKILNDLYDNLNFIDTLVEYIRKKKIKLSIVSTTSHDLHISLFIASRIANIPCLVIGHGLRARKNIFLDSMCFFNGRISKFEHTYKKSFDLKFSPKWL